MLADSEYADRHFSEFSRQDTPRSSVMQECDIAWLFILYVSKWCQW